MGRNDRPLDGIYANIRRTTRAEYHNERKFVIKKLRYFTVTKKADSLINDTNTDFWKKT